MENGKTYWIKTYEGWILGEIIDQDESTYVLNLPEQPHKAPYKLNKLLVEKAQEQLDLLKENV